MIETDVLVVGAGSAGAALAARLCENANREVLLVECGPDYASAATPPVLSSIAPVAALSDPDVAGVYLHAGLDAARSSGQTPLPYPRGRGVGGSSAINGLFAVRPTVEDLNEWAASGCAGWSFDEALPRLNQLESDVEFGDLPYHGASGPLPVMRPEPDDFDPLVSCFRIACLERGHEWVLDHNAPGSTGVSPYAYNARNGRRVSTNDAYLEPARARPNLTIMGDTAVDRVLFDGLKAIGAMAIRSGSEIEIRAEEVVLCAGAVHTPSILLRSGVGPPDHLRDLGIRVQLALPVGLGLQDHAAIALFITRDYDSGAVGEGRHSSVCLRFDPGAGQGPNGGMIAALNEVDRGMDALIGWVNHVQSTGSVRLSTPDPRDHPIVSFNMLVEAADRRGIRAVAEEMQALGCTEAMSGLGSRRGLLADRTTGQTVPIDDALADSALDELLLRAVFDTSHATSSCRMGSPDDATTVADPVGRVHGTQGLRVADASVLPSVPRANTHLSAVLVGEVVAASFEERAG